VQYCFVLQITDPVDIFGLTDPVDILDKLESQDRSK